MILYVSDLDGTLLNSRQELSLETVETINQLIEQGMDFSIATARSINTAEMVIKPLNLKLPIILNNGVFIYDPMKRTAIESNFIACTDACEVVDECERAGFSPLLFTIRESGECKVYYKGVFHPGEEFYIRDRLSKGDRRFTLVSGISEYLGEDIIAFILIGDKEQLGMIYDSLSAKLDLGYHYAQDIYSKAYWLEITHRKANKSEALISLKKLLGADRTVCFGDHLNDCPMFEAADEKYAVENAHTQLKRIATRIIGNNEQDGVARYLKTLLGTPYTQGK